MDIFTVQQWDKKTKRWIDVERFRDKAAAEAKAAAIKGSRIQESYRPSFKII